MKTVLMLLVLTASIFSLTEKEMQEMQRQIDSVNALTAIYQHKVDSLKQLHRNVPEREYEYMGIQRLSPVGPETYIGFVPKYTEEEKKENAKLLGILFGFSIIIALIGSAASN